MTRSKTDVLPEDRFSLWYRFKSIVVFNLLYLSGPAQLDAHNDPRTAVEKEYERRRNLHRERLGKPPIVAKPASSKGGLDVVVICAAGGVLALVVLLVWAVLSAR